MRFKTVLFDLDGTLTDPGEGFANSMRAALREAGLREPTLRQLRLHIGPPLQQSFLELGAHPEQIESLVETYRKSYRETGMFENAVYPRIPELLEELRSRGCQLFVATSKPSPFAEAILEHFELRSFFRGVFGSELDGSLSDKHQLLSHIRECIAFMPSTTALVGDRRFDITAARSEGLFSVGALWGYGPHAELVAAEADALAEKPRDVLNALAASHQV